MKRFESPQRDRYIHDRLPPREHWPEILALDGKDNNERFNCTDILLDNNLGEGRAQRIAVYGLANGLRREWTYAQLNERVCRIANVLKSQFGIVPGNRVMIYAPNSPEVAAIWLAIQKIGAIGVTTLSLLRAGELAKLIAKSKPGLVVSNSDGADVARQAAQNSAHECRVLGFEPDGGELYQLMREASDKCETCPTLGSDISIMAFTSGTTGDPKASVHFHSDIEAICETMCRHVITATSDDVFISTSPLAFTFGLGGLLVFPFFAGAASVLIERYTPEKFVAAIDLFSASVCFTVPTFYQRLIKTDAPEKLAELRIAVSSGEALAAGVADHLQRVVGVNLIEVIGSTELLHAFAGANCIDSRSGYIGPAINGFKLAILDDNAKPVATGETGNLAVKGPTGCRYFDDARQSEYVKDGWNITGDACHMDSDGNIAFHSRVDDMIISAGYNICGGEVENVLLAHSHVEECAVIGVADAKRGQIVEAHIVLTETREREADIAVQLQNHVKSILSPHKYPRSIIFAHTLPKTATGKIKRHELRDG